MNYPQHPQPYQQYPAPPPPGWGYAPPPPSRHGGMSIAGMILGIVSLALCFTPLLVPVVISTIVGLALSIIGRVQAKDNNEKTGCATAGIICNSIAALMIAFAVLALATGEWSLTM